MRKARTWAHSVTGLLTTVASNDAPSTPPDGWTRSSVRHNLLANLGGNGLSLLISLACVPIYIRVLGVAGYGLIGVWMTLENISNIVDLGLSPTITREMAACSARSGGAQDARDLVRTLEAGYWAIGLVIGGVIISCVTPISAHWLRSDQLPDETLRRAIVLIGILIFCRWPLSFYCGGLTGLERQVLLSGVSTAYAYARGLGSVFVLLFVSPTISAFFVFQIAINVVQTAVLTTLMWRCLPSGRTPRFRPELVRRIGRFAGGTSANALLFLLISQLDKVVVSVMLPLESFGYYTLGSRVAACLSVASSPVFAAFFPAFSRHVVSGDEEKLADLYHRGSQLMSALVLPAAVTVIFFANPLIFAWTGKKFVADHTSIIAALLTAGSAVNCLLNTPYALQLAYGWTRLAFWSNLFALCISIPLLLILTRQFGAAGAAGVWLIVNLSYFATDVIPMHRRLLKSEAKRWFLKDIGIPLIAIFVCAVLLFERTDYSSTRLMAGLTVILASSVLGGVGFMATPLTRKQFRMLILRKLRVSSLSA
jgi:O-antigen/teichoic acid export membrane protein